MQKQQNLKNLQELKEMVCPRTIEEQFIEFLELCVLIAQRNQNPNEAFKNAQFVDISKKHTLEGNILEAEILKRSGKIVKGRYRVNIATDYHKYITLYLLSNDKVFIVDNNDTMKEGLYLDIDEAIDIYSGNLRTII